jgi:hypothetical protein
MRFFFDRCAAIGLAKMVRAIDEKQFEIVHHDEDPRFSENTTDIEWMRALAGDGEPRWIVISGDGKILKNKVERQVLDEAKLMFFCLDRPWQEMPIHDCAWKFMKVWPKITETAQMGKGKLFRVRAGTALTVEAI